MHYISARVIKNFVHCILYTVYQGYGYTDVKNLHLTTATGAPPTHPQRFERDRNVKANDNDSRLRNTNDNDSHSAGRALN